MNESILSFFSIGRVKPKSNGNMKNYHTKKTNHFLRRDFIKKSLGVSAGIMIIPAHVSRGNGAIPRMYGNGIEGVIGEGQVFDENTRPSFLNKPYPVITGIMAGQTPREIIASARNSESEGAGGIAIDLFDLKPEFRNYESFKEIVNSVNLPFMFYFYRNDRREQLGDDDRQEVLLVAAEAGASMIDVMGDLYDPSANEITFNQNAINKQKRLIGKIHSKGADVVISSHTGCPLTTEEVIRHMLELESRGPDVVKIVTTINTEEELAEALRTTIALNRELKTPFIHLCSGKYSRPHRFMCPVLGTSILFAVPYYSDRYPGLAQPTIKSMNAVLDNIRWNIHDVG
jgi:3-dehydroquinate dehydratase